MGIKISLNSNFNAESVDCRNIIAYGKNGEMVWRIEGNPYTTRYYRPLEWHDSYPNIFTESDDEGNLILKAINWDGIIFKIDPNNGSVERIGQSR